MADRQSSLRINDLNQSSELDRAAMRHIIGGSARALVLRQSAELLLSSPRPSRPALDAPFARFIEPTED